MVVVTPSLSLLLVGGDHSLLYLRYTYILILMGIYPWEAASLTA